MPGSFLDTNVLVYLASSDPVKAERALAAISAGGAISTQVVNELANVARRKLKLSWHETHVLLDTVRSLLATHDLTVAVHEDGLRIAERYQLSIYDAMIAASALAAGCDVLLTEDLQHGMMLDGRLRVVNPFQS